MGISKVQVPAKHDIADVERIDAIVRGHPLCAGRSTVIRHAVKEWLRLFAAGMVTLSGAEFLRSEKGEAMGITQQVRSFRLSTEAMLELDDIRRALTPFVNNDSECVKLCIAVVHAMLHPSENRRSMLRVLQALSRMNRGKVRTEQETQALRRKYEDMWDRKIARELNPKLR